MARATNKLTVRGVAALREPGIYSDGAGLYLKIDESSRRWVFIFTVKGGRRREMGLGSASDVSLAEARDARDKARQLVRQGIDPIAQRRAEAEPVKNTPLFGPFADDLVDDHASGWRNPKHVDQWRMTLGPAYCASIRDKPVDQISMDDVLEILRPIWTTKAETASRLRGRIEKVLDAAKARGHRTGENPARWRGHLNLLLPKRRKLQRGHHAAMPYADVFEFMQRLGASDAPAARAFEFLILTAARSGEVLGAQWSEFDFDAAVWTVPSVRMKANREHRVPLSSVALGIVQKLHGRRDLENPFVFQGQRKNRPLSASAMEMLRRRLHADGVTVHGFRSSFRDWTAEETDFPREIAEAALAHVVGNETERAYRRGDALEKRRELMTAWANFVTEVGDGDE